MLSRAIVGLALAQSLSGCFLVTGLIGARMGDRTYSGQIANPAVAGGVAPNRIAAPDAETESYRGLPANVLADDVTLVSFDPAGACFDMAVRELAGADTPSIISVNDLELEVDDDDLASQPNIQPSQPMTQSFDGLVSESYVTGYVEECTLRTSNGACNRWETRPQYGSRLVPGVVTVQQIGARVCFANDGKLGPTNRKLALTFKPGSAFTSHTTFEWVFTGYATPASEPVPSAATASR